MNQKSSTQSQAQSTTAHARPTAEQISQRAYELWERNGRPDGDDMRHWLDAERELTGRNGTSDQSRQQASDSRPLQGTRAGAAANREGKRTSSQNPFGAEKVGTATGNGKMDTAGRRRM